MEETLFKDRYKKGLNSYTFKELEETIKEFKKEYPEGKNFKIESLAFEMYGDMDSYFRFTCESPETKEEKLKRELKSRQYLKLKAEFEGEQK